MAAYIIVRYGLENPNSTIWWVAPTYDDANDYGFDNVVPLLSRDLLAGEPKLTKPRSVSLINGTHISFRSAEREDSLRGGGVDLLVTDESGSVADRAFTSELRPTLTDTGGKLLAIGTPAGRRGWFWEWALRGQDPDRDDVALWRGPTAMNPHIPPGEIEAAKRDTPSHVFRQEYLAEFISDSGAAFPDLGPATAGHTVPIPPEAAALAPPVALGVDLGRKENYTAITALDSAGSVAEISRLRHISWKRIQKRIERVAADYDAVVLAVDATRDNSVVEYLIERHNHSARVLPVTFSGQSKRTMIDNLAAALEAGNIGLPDSDASEDADALHRELGAYGYEFTGAGNRRYGAPSGIKDDTVDSLALAWKAKGQAHRAARRRESARSSITPRKSSVAGR